MFDIMPITWDGYIVRDEIPTRDGGVNVVIERPQGAYPHFTSIYIDENGIKRKPIAQVTMSSGHILVFTK